MGAWSCPYGLRYQFVFMHLKAHWSEIQCHQPVQQDSNGVKSSNAVANGGFWLQQTTEQSHKCIFVSPCGKERIVYLEYEKKLSFVLKSLSVFCQIKWENHLISLCFDDTLCTEWENTAFLTGILWRCTYIGIWGTIVMGIGKGPEAERGIRVLNIVRI